MKPHNAAEASCAGCVSHERANAVNARAVAIRRIAPGGCDRNSRARLISRVTASVSLKMHSTTRSGCRAETEFETATERMAEHAHAFDALIGKRQLQTLHRMAERPPF